jgi:hypothetical protein
VAQITIYLDESSEIAVKEAAAEANLSVSRWFAQFAEAEKSRRNQDWAAHWAKIDKHRTEWQDFPLADAANQDLAVDTTRELL